MKEQARRCDGELKPEAAAAACEVAWGCVRNMLDRAIVIPVGQAEILQAFTYKRIHDDLEDDIVPGRCLSRRNRLHRDARQTPLAPFSNSLHRCDAGIGAGGKLKVRDNMCAIYGPEAYSHARLDKEVSGLVY